MVSTSTCAALTLAYIHTATHQFPSVLLNIAKQVI